MHVSGRCPALMTRFPRWSVGQQPANQTRTSDLPRVMGAPLGPASTTRRVVVGQVRLVKTLKVQAAGHASNFVARVGQMPERSCRDRPKESNLIRVRKLAAGPIACRQCSVDDMRRCRLSPDVASFLPESIDHELASRFCYRDCYPNPWGGLRKLAAVYGTSRLKARQNKDI